MTAFLLTLAIYFSSGCVIIPGSCVFIDEDTLQCLCVGGGVTERPTGPPGSP